jgi:hypothetical protein
MFWLVLYGDFFEENVRIERIRLFLVEWLSDSKDLFNLGIWFSDLDNIHNFLRVFCLELRFFNSKYLRIFVNHNYIRIFKICDQI